MYKLFLTLRYLRKRRIAYFAVAAVMLCVAMVLVVMSVMGGFLDTLKKKARGLLGDVIVDNRSLQGFPFYQEFIDDVKKWPEIAQATPVIYTYGLLRFKTTDQTAMVQVIGLRLEEVYQVNAFKRSLFYEKYYPGTTHLGDQQQPLRGYDLKAAPIPIKMDGQTLYGPPPALPPPYQEAWKQALARGIVDDESVESAEDARERAAGWPIFPGIYRPIGEMAPPALDGDPRPGIIIGRDIVASRQPDGRYQRYHFYPRGCIVILTLLPLDESGKLEEMPSTRIQPFRYADDSRTGIYNIDKEHVYCDFNLLQQLLQMDPAERAEGGGMTPARCSQIQIKLADGADARATAQRLQEHYRSFIQDARFQLDKSERRMIESIDAKTWEESQAHMIAPVEKERHLVTILFGVISLVAAVLTLCILYMIVLQKTRDIGIVKSIGGSSAGVACIFLLYGAAVGIVGSALGAVLGSLFVTYINEIQEFLTRLNPSWQVWDRAVYSFDEIPHTIRAVDIVVVIISAIIASTFGSFVAAWRAGAMQPVEALRDE